MVSQIGCTVNVVEENESKLVTVTTTTIQKSPVTVRGRAVIYTKKI